jgi:hypothetical protein
MSIITSTKSCFQTNVYTAWFIHNDIKLIISLVTRNGLNTHSEHTRCRSNELTPVASECEYLVNVSYSEQLRYNAMVYKWISSLGLIKDPAHSRQSRSLGSSTLTGKRNFLPRHVPKWRKGSLNGVNAIISRKLLASPEAARLMQRHQRS